MTDLNEAETNSFCLQNGCGVISGPQGSWEKNQESFVFFKKGAESPQQLGLWFDSYYKGRASVFENEMKTASHNPFFLFHQGAGAPEYFSVLMHLHQNIENVFVCFYLTYLLPTKAKEGKCHN